jgi:acetyl-CoA C-acetyltransferase
MAQTVVLAGAVRTPIGAFLGSLAQVPAARLGSVAVCAALSRAGVAPDQVDEVILGNVLSAGQGQNPARQATLGAGLPHGVGATTINKVCGSGLKAVMLACQAIQCGAARVVVAGGMENMSAAPYLLPKVRSGYRMGHAELIDAMIHDGLWDVYHDQHMGSYGDRCAERCGLSRQQQDDFAVASYRRALAAQENGLFREELTPVELVGRKGTVVVERDEEPARFHEEKLRQLKPAFGAQGTVTAGNASSINDAAAAVVVLAAERAAELGVRPQARVLGAASYAREPEWFTLAPIGALECLMQRLGLTVRDMDLFEINEAFSVVPLAVMQALGITHEKVNVHGGAVALGHPIGASGARILVTLIHALQRRGLRRGVAALCIGGGEAVALAIETL